MNLFGQYFYYNGKSSARYGLKIMHIDTERISHLSGEAAHRLVNRRPLRQHLLPLSATGGGRKRCPAHAPRASDLKAFAQTKIETDTLQHPFLFWQGQKDLNPRHAVLETAALPTELYPFI